YWLWRFGGELAEFGGGLVEGGAGFGAFGFGDGALMGAPELVDGLNAPEGALAGGADRFVVDEDVDGVGVELGELAEGNPGAFFDFDFEIEVVDLAVSGDFFG